jgi:hypothetical protein
MFDVPGAILRFYRRHVLVHVHVHAQFKAIATYSTNRIRFNIYFLTFNRHAMQFLTQTSHFLLENRKMRSTKTHREPVSYSLYPISNWKLEIATNQWNIEWNIEQSNGMFYLFQISLWLSRVRNIHACFKTFSTSWTMQQFAIT